MECIEVKDMVIKNMVDTEILNVLSEKFKPGKKNRIQAFQTIVERINKGIETGKLYTDYPINIAVTLGWYRVQTIKFLKQLEEVGALNICPRKNKMITLTFGEGIQAITEMVTQSCDKSKQINSTSA